MCRWMGWHFHVWIYYSGAAFSLESLEWGRTFSGFGGSEHSCRQGFINEKIFPSLSLTNVSIHFRNGLLQLKDFIRLMHKKKVTKGRTIRKVIVGVGNFRAAGIFFRYQIPCMNFFRPQHEYFLGLIGVHEFFSFNFPLSAYFFGTSPSLPPP